MLPYKIILKNKVENQQWELPYKSGLIEWRHNSIHTGTIYVDYVYLRDYLTTQGTTPKNLFESGFLKVYIYFEETLLFSGFVSDIRYSKFTQAFTVEIGIKSWLGYFENRYLTKTYLNTDQGAIAWDAINSVNDIGITQGTIEATKNRDRTYVMDDVAKIVTQLTSDAIIDGMEFEITNDKVFTSGSIIGTERANIILDEGNVYDWSVSVKLVGGVFTDGIILGGGIGEDQIVRTYDAGSIYENAWYKQEALINDVNVEDTDILDDKIKQYIELRKNPIRILNVKTMIGNLTPHSCFVGDSVKINLPDAEISEIRRIRKKVLFFGDNDYMQYEFTYENE